MAWCITVLLFGLVSPVTVGADVLDEQPLPEGGRVWVDGGDDPLARATNKLAPAGTAVFEPVGVAGQSFGRAVRVRTLTAPAAGTGAIDLNYYATARVAKGDALLVTFVARGEGTMGREARIEVRVDRGSGGWDLFGEQVLGVGPEWRRYYVPMRSPGDYPAGEGRLSLRMGFEPQSVEIADVRVLNYGRGRSPNDLPRTRVTYAGREPDAPWRRQAEQRIERHRKADLTVRVVDAAGKPVDGATVHVKMRRHAFPFGTAVSTSTLMDPANEAYRQKIVELFRHVTIEWENNQKDWDHDRRRAIDGIRWLHDRGIAIHGCHIIWPGTPYLPESILAMTDRPADMRQALLAHVDDKLNALHGLVTEWNGINEPTSNRFVEDALGRDFLVEIHRRAKQVDPSVRLHINDYADIASPSTAAIDRYIEFVADLKRRGAPIDVVGLQCHFGNYLRSPDEAYAILDRFAALGYPLHASEFDVNTTDPQVQADYTRDMTMLLFSHPAVEQITLWGFWEGRHWLPAAALWRTDWTIKPNGQAWLDLVTKAWWTDATVTTDAAGRATVRGFLGDYEITAGTAGATTSASCILIRSGTEATMKIGATD